MKSLSSSFSNLVALTEPTSLGSCQLHQSTKNSLSVKHPFSSAKWPSQLAKNFLFPHNWQVLEADQEGHHPRDPGGPGVLDLSKILDLNSSYGVSNKSQPSNGSYLLTIPSQLYFLFKLEPNQLELQSVPRNKLFPTQELGRP